MSIAWLAFGYSIAFQLTIAVITPALIVGADVERTGFLVDAETETNGLDLALHGERASDHAS